MKKERLDVLLVNRGMFESRAKAQAAVMAGQVLVNEQKIDISRYRYIKCTNNHYDIVIYLA